MIHERFNPPLQMRGERRERVEGEREERKDKGPVTLYYSKKREVPIGERREVYFPVTT